MKLIELMQECRQKTAVTSLQRIAKCRSYIGSEIEMTFKIHDIVESMIFLNLNEGYEKNDTYSGLDSEFEFYFHLTYDNSSFGKQLLEYSRGTLVKINAKLIGADFSTCITADFVLSAICKVW